MLQQTRKAVAAIGFGFALTFAVSQVAAQDVKKQLHAWSRFLEVPHIQVGPHPRWRPSKPNRRPGNQAVCRFAAGFEGSD